MRVAEVDAFARETSAERVAKRANVALRAQPSALSPPQREFRVLGMTQGQALRYSGARENDSVFSPEHEHGDMANRWSHGAVVKLSSNAIESAGVPQTVAALLGASLIVTKEFAYDKRPDPRDMVIADFEVYRSPAATLSLSGFADGSVFGDLRGSF